MALTAPGGVAGVAAGDEQAAGDINTQQTQWTVSPLY